ncbi:7058_t:CDS:2, partial [Racocetra persica]
SIAVTNIHRIESSGFVSVRLIVQASPPSFNNPIQMNSSQNEL